MRAPAQFRGRRSFAFDKAKDARGEIAVIGDK
jgi:hypothetical protein